MKVLGVMTENFRVYYDLIRALRERHIPFICLSLSDKIPQKVGVILTTREESKKIRFSKKVLIGKDISRGIQSALKILTGRETFRQLIIGIDPGEKPGIAIVGDYNILDTQIAPSPESTLKIVKKALSIYSCAQAVIKIGHGDATHRNRTINALSPLKIGIYIVDEKGTTKRSAAPDIDAALDIIFGKGYLARTKYDVKIPHGEIKELQRRSRIISNGEFTISRDLAKSVAKGKLTMAEAIRKQKTKHRSCNL